MNTCPHCGSALYYHWDQGFDEYRCGSTVPGYRTNRCVEIEPIWKELQSAKERIEALEKAGDKLMEVMRGDEGIPYGDWIVTACDAENAWRKAKEVKP